MINSLDFDELEKMINTAISCNIRIYSISAYFEWILIPLCTQIESQINVKKTNKMFKVFFKIFIDPYRITLESQKSIIEQTKKNTTKHYNLEKKALETYQEMLRILRSIFYNCFKVKNKWYVTDLIELYKNISISWLAAENWERVEEIIDEILEVNRYLHKNQEYKNESLDMIDLVSYVILYYGKKEIFYKIISHIKYIILSSEETISKYHEILIALALYAHKWNKTEEKTYILKILVLLNIKITENEINSAIDIDRFSLDESYYLSHTIGRDNKEQINQTEKRIFLRDLNILKIKVAQNTASKIELILKIKESYNEAKKISKFLNRKKEKNNIRI